MEEEIDLRIYLDILLKWWWLIAVAAAGLGVMALLVSFVMPPEYKATASVVSLKSRAEISLGSGLRTITEDNLNYGNMVGSTAIVERMQQRLNTLAGVVKNGAIAQEVAQQLSEYLDEEDRDPTRLLEYVEGRILELKEGGTGVGGGDTIQIVVSHKDPIIAARIANAWAQSYETYINKIYGEASLSPFVNIQTQVQKARADYDAAQEAYLQFVSEDDRINEVKRQIDEETIIINNLRKARQTAISAVVDKEIQVLQALIDAYLSDVKANRLFAFEKGQSAKREILGALIDSEISNRLTVIHRDRDIREQLFKTAVSAEIAARLQVFEQERDALRADLEEDYNRKRRIENLVEEAEMMREQLIQGGEASARSNGLALLAFKSRVFSAAEGLPFDRLDLQAASIDALNPDRTAAEQIADLDALITAMHREVQRLEAAIREKSIARLNGEGYQFLDLLSPEYLTLSFTQTLGTDEALVASTLISPNLSDFILERYADMFEVGSLALSAQQVATDTQLFGEIEKLYPELYTKDPWMELSDLVPETPQLVSLANQIANDLLKMKGLEKLLAFSVLEEPLSKEIAQRELRVRGLDAEVSRLVQEKKDLEQNRDLAWQAYSVLLSKAQEVIIASASEGSEVRFASPALPPREPVRPKKLLNTATGIVVGLMGGVVGAFLFNYLGLDSHPRVFWAQITKRKPVSA